MTQIIYTWDSGQPGAQWDTGLQWDVNSGLSFGDIEAYAKLITSEHRVRPNFMAMVSATIQPIADLQANVMSMPAAFDLDTAGGSQEDVLGQWIGVSRQMTTPLTDVYFSFDTENLGFDQGTWSSRFQPTTEFVLLSDDQYRLLLRARIANNNWDGTIPGAYNIWNTVFAGTGYGILIFEPSVMHIAFALTGNIPDAVTLALFTGGHLSIKPAGVQIDGYATPTVSDTPYFGFDVQNDNLAGFDTGAWGKISLPA